MQIHCQAQQAFRCSPQAVFDLMVDTQRFPATFTGYGLIPAIRSITLHGPLAVGATRRIENSDGSVLSEQVTALTAPSHHAYILSGFAAPFAWLVTQGAADWQIDAVADGGTWVRWRYDFTLTSRLAYPLAALVLRGFMARALQRCLVQMAAVLDNAAGMAGETV
jgi:ribosome-associated toxin RatA of RatAB toxin-antitoxin module